jgi:hypothetical protein
MTVSCIPSATAAGEGAGRRAPVGLRALRRMSDPIMMMVVMVMDRTTLEDADRLCRRRVRVRLGTGEMAPGTAAMRATEGEPLRLGRIIVIIGIKPESESESETYPPTSSATSQPPRAPPRSTALRRAMRRTRQRQQQQQQHDGGGGGPNPARSAEPEAGGGERSLGRAGSARWRAGWWRARWRRGAVRVDVGREGMCCW